MVSEFFYFFFSEDMPPQLSLHVASGHASVGPAGEVLVYPGSIFHIDCLFDRRKGNPQWTLSKPGKKYATGEIDFSCMFLNPKFFLSI